MVTDWKSPASLTPRMFTNATAHMAPIAIAMPSARWPASAGTSATR